MKKLLASVVMAIILMSCGNADPLSREAKELTQKIGVVADELSVMGFEVDLSDIKIRVESAEVMASIFNNLSDKSQKRALGPKALFNDGINSRLAFYDPNSKTIILREGADEAVSKGYLAHELAHVYQDQKWGFSEIWKPYHNDSTRELFNITQFIIEGYAEMVRKAYEQNQEKGTILASDLSVTLGRIVENDCLPCDSETSAGDLPYSMGLRFLVHQYRLGGWKLVDEMMTNLPKSSEQIIHPNKYELDFPTRLSMPAWQNDNGAKLISDESLGEAALLSKLLGLSVPGEVALRAASGWEGDRAQLYRTSDGQEILIWRIIFDRMIDARQLEEALKSFQGSNIFRVARTVDWIIGGSKKLKKSARIFLSQTFLSIESDIEDENSTIEQEISLKNDANDFNNPYLVKKIYIGPKNLTN